MYHPLRRVFNEYCTMHTFVLVFLFWFLLYSAHLSESVSVCECDHYDLKV